MVDFLRLIAEGLSRALPALLARRQGRERRELAIGLYFVYIAINEALIRAELIVEDVETIANDQGLDPTNLRHAHLRLERELADQVLCFKNIAELLRASARELQLLDGQEFAALYILLHRKSRWLHRLGGIVRAGKYPLHDDAGLDDWTTRVHGLPTRPSQGWLDLDAMTVHDRLEPVPIAEAVAGGETRRQLRTYIEERQPRKQLPVLREHLEAMRSALLELVSVEDLFLKVGDEAFRHLRRRSEAPPLPAPKPN